MSSLIGSSIKRVLHVLGGLDPGGIETWLVHSLRLVDRDRMRWDFAVNAREPGAYESEVRALGSRVFVCGDHRKPWLFTRRLSDVLCRHGPYDAVHSHVARYSGIVLWVARRHRVPIRIAHSHNLLPPGDSEQLARQVYLWIARWLIRRCATQCLAASEAAGTALFGEGMSYSVLRCGIELKHFLGPLDRGGTRRDLEIPGDSLVIGHVGRFEPQKNHEFLLEVAGIAMRREPRVHLLLVGKGRLHSRMERRACELGIRSRVVFAGLRGNVPQLMQDAMDVFVFPSVFEGLGLVVLEAQAAGLPTLISTNVPADAVVIPELVTRISAQASAEEWADAALRRLGEPRPMSPSDALARIATSPFAIERSIVALIEFYGGY